MLIVITVVAALAACLVGLWLTTRVPELRRRLTLIERKNKDMHGLLLRLLAEARGYADVNPVAQVFVDEITNALGTIEISRALGEPPSREGN